MRITRIERQARRPGRVNVYVDGRFAVGANAETVLRLALRSGDPITAAALDDLRRADELVAARSSALRLLSTRPRTVRELRDRLREKEYGDDAITRVLADLEKAGLLNDEEFVRLYARNALAVRPVGRTLLKRKLLLLGVDRALVERVLTEELAGIDQMAVATGIARQYLRKAGPRAIRGDPRVRRRLVAALARRGFAWEVIDSAVRATLPHSSGSGDE